MPEPLDLPNDVPRVAGITTPSAPEPRRVLIANALMTSASGTVTYTRDLALSLLHQGWTPVVYTTRPGTEAEALRQATVPVVSELSRIGGRPDVIHGHHVLETLAAMLCFPDVPVLFVCHDALSWHSVPPRMRRLYTFVAVDRNCRDRMVFEHGIPEERIHVLVNTVDLRRFVRRAPLPARPRNALVFSNAASDATFVPQIREACRSRGIEVDVAGIGADALQSRPEELLLKYDLVFAKARCALEALAVGTAVIGCDRRGMSGMVSVERFDALHQLNFGARTLQLPITQENLLREIDRYDPAGASAVSDRVRRLNDSDLIASQFIELYEGLPAMEPVEMDDRLEMAAALEQVAKHFASQLGEKPHGRLRGLFLANRVGRFLRSTLKGRR